MKLKVVGTLVYTGARLERGAQAVKATLRESRRL